jgi:hypothetical protein
MTFYRNLPFYGAAFIALGIFFWYFSFKDADWFIDTRKTRALIALVRRKPLRMFYMVMGVLLALLGVGALLLSLG